jgi:hypothetical protein
MSQVTSAFNSATPPVRNLNTSVNDLNLNLKQIPSSASSAGDALTRAATSNTYQWRLLEQEIGTRVPMALNRVMVQSQAMSAIMGNIFPIAVAAGFATVVGRIAMEFLDWASNQKAVIAGIEDVGRTLERVQSNVRKNVGETQSARDATLGLTRGPDAERQARIARLQLELTQNRAALAAANAAAATYRQPVPAAGMAGRGVAALWSATHPIDAINDAITGLRYGAPPVITQSQRESLAVGQAVQSKAAIDRAQTELNKLQAQGRNYAVETGMAGARESLQYQNFLASMTRREEGGPVGSLLSTYQRGVQEQGLRRDEELSKPGGTTGIPANYGAQSLAAFNRGLISLAQQEQQKEAVRSTAEYTRYITEARPRQVAEAWRYGDSGAHLSPEHLHALEAQQKADEETLRTSDRLGEIQGRGQIDMLRREFGHAGAISAGGTGDAGTRANQQYQLRIQLAQQINSIEVATANSVANDSQRAIQLEQAKYQLIAEGDQARLDRQLEFQKIQEKQLQETANFASGLVNAGLQGGRAPVRFMENYAHQIISTVAGNAGKMFLGPMESIFSLGKSGILGSPGSPNMIGQMLQGTIFGANPMDQAQGQMVYYLSDIATNMRVVASTLAPGRASGGTAGNPSGAAAGGVAGGILADSQAILRGLRPGVGGGVQVGSHTFPSLAALVQKVWGAGRGSYGSAPSVTDADVAMLTGIPMDSATQLAPDGLPMPSTKALMPLVLGTGEPKGTSAMGGAIWAGAYSAIGALSHGSWQSPSAARMLGISGTSLAMIGGGIGGKGVSQAISGGDALNVLSGYGAWSKPDANGIQTAQPLSTSQQIGGYISLAGTEIAGISSAVSGFSKGGASGDIQGIAGIATAVAPFTGPAAPFVMAGAAMLSLISSLFTTGPQQRQLNEQRQLLNNAYVRLSPRQYNFSADGQGGFALDAYGGAVSGAPNTVYPLTPGLTDMTAQQLRAFAGNNPTMWSVGVAAALTSGGDSQMGSLLNFIQQYGGN